MLFPKVLFRKKEAPGRAAPHKVRFWAAPLIPRFRLSLLKHWKNSKSTPDQPLDWSPISESDSWYSDFPKSMKQVSYAFPASENALGWTIGHRRTEAQLSLVWPKHKVGGSESESQVSICRLLVWTSPLGNACDNNTHTRTRNTMYKMQSSGYDIKPAWQHFLLNLADRDAVMEFGEM